MDNQESAERGHRPGRWLPDQDSLEAWLEGLTQKVEEKPSDAPLHPVVEEFRQLIERDPIVRMDLTRMIEQVPHTRKYRRRHVESVDQLLRLIDEILGRAPEFNETALVGLPLNAVLD